MFVLYKPKLSWNETTPPATLWLHNRKLEKGMPYDKDTLEAGILEWAR
jgi:hypothetical protein